jgi:starch phosphorylase
MDTKVKNFKRTSAIAKIKIEFLNNLRYLLAKDEYSATPKDLYEALAKTAWEPLVDNWIDTQQTYYRKDAKRIYYLSLEFLMGRTLQNTLVNLKMENEYTQAITELGYKMEELAEEENDAGLGNGGLGRLAACFLDSMATMSLPGYGYGIRYEYGIFRQEIKDGYQIEHPDNWLRYNNPWEVPRPEAIYPIKYYGEVKEIPAKDGKKRKIWTNTKDVLAMAYDTPIPGYGNKTVNTLRLWSAKSTREFNLESFNQADYVGAVADKINSENISSVLYPNDLEYLGKELRLKQQYFFSSASLQDALRRYKKTHDDIEGFKDKVVFQLNDTHPSIAIPELLRLLVDEEGLGWEKAWEIVTHVFAYTNHTLMPEALETWPVPLLSNLLPRHMELIYEINDRFLKQMEEVFPGDIKKMERLSIIDEKDGKYVRMANLAIVGSSHINGVAALHSNLLKTKMFPDFYELYPKKFTNKTNGITQRRWLLMSNPKLSALITETIGSGWKTDLKRMEKLREFAGSAEFRKKWQEIKHFNKISLAAYLKETQGISINPNTLFDIQVKRMHEYKRQLLNALHMIYLYNEIKADKESKRIPRTIMVGGKAAPGYFMAKLIIKLINAIAEVVNNDPDVNRKLNIFFLENYRVSLAEKIFPAAELSEQISTAGTEASGTGNMKFALNGALTIGTLDGANIEMMEEIGAENMFIFGLKEEEVSQLKMKGYSPFDYYNGNPELKRVIDMISDDYFSQKEPGIFKPIIKSLLEEGDRYLLLADFQMYADCQRNVEKAYLNRNKWNEMSILNVAGIGKFSSDRTIAEYNEEIWGLTPIDIGD